MKNKVWCFGDSFTYGDGCNTTLSNEYWETIPGGELWVDIVANYFNMSSVNLGLNGSSNEYIIDSLISNINNFKDGDIVIVGSTIGNRFQLYDEISKSYHQYQPHVLFEYETSQTFPGKLTDHTENDEIYNKNTLKLLQDFSILFKNDKISDVLNLKHDTIINNLLKFISSNTRIKTLHWGYLLWTKYETIREVSTIPNGHWSWNGHMQWANKCIELIENNQVEFGTTTQKKIII